MDAARPILLEILKKDENIEQAWFLLSYTLPPGEKQEYALNQALKINPEFDRARDRLEKLKVQEGGIQPEDSLLESEGSSDLDEIVSAIPQSNESELDEKSRPEPFLNKEEDKDPLNSFPEETFIVDVDENSDEELET